MVAGKAAITTLVHIVNKRFRNIRQGLRRVVSAVTARGDSHPCCAQMRSQAFFTSTPAPLASSRVYKPHAMPFPAEPYGC